MKERPILFSGPMIRAILEGRKTQTRRVIKPQPAGEIDNLGDGDSIIDLLTDAVIACPYGQPGDRLIVRESGWERQARTPRMLRDGADTWAPYYYDADGLTEADVDDFKRWGFKRRPSIHMPRWASRITLEVEAVRVERVNEITEEDAKSEGANREAAYDDPDLQYESCDGIDRGAGPGYFCPRSYKAGFSNLWDSINSSRGFGWEANPWVWVITFKRV